MHFPSLSATLPRRWRHSSSENVSSAKKPPKSSSNFGRRFSSIAAVSSSRSPAISSAKPPKGGRQSFSSQLCRSSSFSAHHTLVPTDHSTACSDNIYLSDTWKSARVNSFTSGTCHNNSTFDFKKPLPPPPKLQRQSYMPAPFVRNEGKSPSYATSNGRSYGNDAVPLNTAVIPLEREWRSQSLVSLSGKASLKDHNHMLSAHSTQDSQRPKTGSEQIKQSLKPFQTFGTPRTRRKLSVPSSLSFSFTNFKDKRPSLVPSSSSQDGLQKLCRESEGSCCPLDQPGISTATIFSKNLRSNSWRNLSLIGKVEPLQQEQKDQCELKKVTHLPLL